MMPESVWNTLAGGLIGFLSSLGVLVIRDWQETRKRRRLLIDAIDSAARPSSVPAVISAYTGRHVYFSPAEQFLAIFWRDLPLLGTYTQMMVVTFFSTLIELTKMEGVPSRDLLETQEELRKSLMALLEEERRGERQNIGRGKSPIGC